MKIKLGDKNGVLLKTENKYVAEDIEVGLTKADQDALVPNNLRASVLGVEAGIQDYDGTYDGEAINSQAIIDGMIDGTTTEITSNVESMRDYTFYNCTYLKSIDLPNLKIVGNSCFTNCSSLETVNLPSATQIRSSSTFANLSKLSSVNIPNVITIPSSCFINCTSLKSIDLPNVNTLNTYVFNGCYFLNYINIPKVTSIGNGCFMACERIESILLPCVTSIGSQAFFNNYSLKSIVIEQTDKVCTLANVNAFNNCYHILGTVNSYNPTGAKDGYIYVPDSLVDSYKSATNWSTYADQIKPLSEYVEE